VAQRSAEVIAVVQSLLTQLVEAVPGSDHLVPFPLKPGGIILLKDEPSSQESKLDAQFGLLRFHIKVRRKKWELIVIKFAHGLSRLPNSGLAGEKSGSPAGPLGEIELDCDKSFLSGLGRVCEVLSPTAALADPTA
jgi:hypothetical protein